MPTSSTYNSNATPNVRSNTGSVRHPTSPRSLIPPPPDESHPIEDSLPEFPPPYQLLDERCVLYTALPPPGSTAQIRSPPEVLEVQSSSTPSVTLQETIESSDLLHVPLDAPSIQSNDSSLEYTFDPTALPRIYTTVPQYSEHTAADPRTPDTTTPVSTDTIEPPSPLEDPPQNTPELNHVPNTAVLNQVPSPSRNEIIESSTSQDSASSSLNDGNNASIYDLGSSVHRGPAMYNNDTSSLVYSEYESAIESDFERRSVNENDGEERQVNENDGDAWRSTSTTPDLSTNDPNSPLNLRNGPTSLSATDQQDASPHSTTAQQDASPHSTTAQQDASPHSTTAQQDASPHIVSAITPEDVTTPQNVSASTPNNIQLAALQLLIQFASQTVANAPRASVSLDSNSPIHISVPASSSSLARTASLPANNPVPVPLEPIPRPIPELTISPQNVTEPNAESREGIPPTQNFVDILSESSIKDFTSYRYCYGGVVTEKNHPSMLDVLAHLKLLKAFSLMKEIVLQGSTTEDVGEKKWQVFVTNAVRRFIVFVSCLRHLFGPKVPSSFDEKKRYETSSSKDALISSAMSELLPPLDVLMVWHSFLLNPRSFYDNFMRNDFYKFANLPFPFHMINIAIDNQTFEYSPDQGLKDGYFAIIKQFTEGNTKTEVLDLLQYDNFKDFNASRYAVNIACPACKTILVKTQYTNDAKTGFADKLFTAKCHDSKSEKSSAGKLASSISAPRGHKCKCNFYNVINHEELRRRQMYNDFKNPVVLPGIYRRFSSVLARSWITPKKGPEYDRSIKLDFKKVRFDEFRKDRFDTLISRLTNTELDTYDPKKTLIYRVYLEMNLIHTTVSPSEDSLLQVIEISEDLVGCVIRQGKFIEKMCETDWLHSPVFKETIIESTLRYERFLGLLIKKCEVVPTLDIDLIWHTHQLSNHYYFKDCLKSRYPAVLDHDDKIEQGTFDHAFRTTCEVWKQEFSTEYTCCMCWYCVAARSKKASGVSSMFKKLKEADETVELSSSAHYNGGSALTHVSTHSGIELQTREAIYLRRKIERKYAKIYGTDSGALSDDVPWKVADRNPDIYVISPVTPIPSYHNEFYGALCCRLPDCWNGGTCMGGECGV